MKTRKILLKSKFLFATLTAGLMLWTVPVCGQVEHKGNFHPQKEVSVKAAAPADLKERQTAFSARNRDAQLKALADRLFGMMRLDWEPEAEALRARYRAAVEAYRDGDYQAAFEAYKLFFLERIMESGDKGMDPATRRFIEYYSDADGLMEGKAKVAAFTKDYPQQLLEDHNPVDAMLNYYRAGLHNEHHVMVNLDIGEPGEVNWTYSLLKDGYYGPTWHMPRDDRFLCFAYGQRPDFFVSLLAAYVDTGDEEYLRRWAAYVDDFHINFIPDVNRSALADSLKWTQIPGPGLDTLIFAMREHPEAVDSLPATTLARMVLHVWNTEIPLQIEQSRRGGGNRRLTMYGRQMNTFFFRFPELAERNYLLRQRRRTLEDHTRVAIHPDGTDREYGLPYFYMYYTIPQKDIKELRGLPEASWLTDRWMSELRRTQQRVGSYVLRSIDPLGHQPGHRHALRDIVRTTPHIRNIEKMLPEMVERPEHRGVMDWHMGDRPAEAPLRSFAFPYGGFYFIWSDWSEKPQFLHLTSARPGSSNRWRFNNNIWLAAHGQLMLFFGGEDYVLEVDGVGGMAEGRLGGALPPLTPQPNRYLSNEHFDLVEARISDDSRVRENPRTGEMEEVGMVEHHRQVMFVRDAGIWIVTDRLRADRQHEYRLLWPFRGDFPFVKNSQDFRNQVREVPEDSYLHGYRPEKDFVFDTERKAIRTVNPHIPNLSIYHASNRPLALPDGDFVQHNWRFANALCAGPRLENAKDVVLVSLLSPRPDLQERLRVFKEIKEDHMAGFDAETTDGYRIVYRAAETSAIPLVAGNVQARGEALLLVTGPDKEPLRGIVLGATEFKIDGKARQIPAPDFAYEIRDDGELIFDSIQLPLEMVEIQPAAERFVDKLTVTLSHPESDVEIRYTLDGTMPDLESALYTKPFEIDATTWVTSIAVRPGTKRILDSTASSEHSIPHWAVYEKEPYREATFKNRPVGVRAGLQAVYKQTDYPISMLNLAALPTTTSGSVPGVFDLSLRTGADPASNYGFIYTGYLEVPEDGVYNFHAPEMLSDTMITAWSDLRVFLDGEEWYPATRRQNYGVWSVPLKAGSHRLEVRWIDQRPSMGIRDQRGDVYGNWREPAPTLEISGPGIDKRPLPAEWLYSK